MKSLLNLKKLLAAIGIVSIAIPSTLSVVACNTSNNSGEPPIKQPIKFTNLWNKSINLFQSLSKTTGLFTELNTGRAFFFDLKKSKWRIKGINKFRTQYYSFLSYVWNNMNC